MKRYLHYVPTFVIAIVVALMLRHGPIPQLERYHEFADHAFWAGIPHAADVLSNLGFALVALWGGFTFVATADPSRSASGLGRVQHVPDRLTAYLSWLNLLSPGTR